MLFVALATRGTNMADINKTNKNNEVSNPVPSSYPPTNGAGSSGGILSEEVKITNTDDKSQVAVVEEQLTGLSIKRKNRKGAH